jgi:hypothetical protein
MSNFAIKQWWWWLFTSTSDWRHIDQITESTPTILFSLYTELTDTKNCSINQHQRILSVFLFLLTTTTSFQNRSEWMFVFVYSAFVSFPPRLTLLFCLSNESKSYRWLLKKCKCKCTANFALQTSFTPLVCSFRK